MDGPPLPIAAVKAAVCARYGLPAGAMTGPNRERVHARPRQVAMYLASSLTGYSRRRVGLQFGRRHHTTVLEAVRRIEALRLTHPEIDTAVAELAAELSNPRREGFAPAEGA